MLFPINLFHFLPNFMSLNNHFIIITKSCVYYRGESFWKKEKKSLNELFNNSLLDPPTHPPRRNSQVRVVKFLEAKVSSKQACYIFVYSFILRVQFS